MESNDRVDMVLDALAHTLLSLRHPSYAESDRAARAVIDLLGALVRPAVAATEDQVDTIAARLEQGRKFIERQGPRMFIGSSRARIDTPSTFQDAVRDQYLRRFANIGAVHVEQGIWKDFPPERVRQIRDAQGLGDFITFDFEPAYGPNVVGDVQAMPFAAETIDRVCSASLYEHLAYPHQAIAEAFRVLRPGGALKITTVFVYTLHGGASPNDYLRYTPAFFKRVCQDVGFETVLTETDSTSGAYYNAHNIMKAAGVQSGVATEGVADRVHMATLILAAALVGFDHDFRGAARSLFKSIDVLAFKAGRPLPRTRPSEGGFIDRNLDLLATPGGGHALELLDGTRLVGGGEQFPIENGIPIFVPPDRRV